MLVGRPCNPSTRLSTAIAPCPDVVRSRRTPLLLVAVLALTGSLLSANPQATAVLPRESGDGAGELTAQLQKASLTASHITSNAALLTLAGHTNRWFYSRTSPGFGICSRDIDAGTPVTAATALEPGTTYTYTAYSNQNCSVPLATVTFTTAIISLSAEHLIVPEDGSAAYTVSLDEAPAETVTISVASTGDSDISVDTSPDILGAQNTLVFTTKDWATAKTVLLEAADDTDRSYGSATITHIASSADTKINGSVQRLKASEGDNDVCANTEAVKNAATGYLVDDCNTLLAAKFMLSGTKTLNWSTSTPVDSWTGVTTSNALPYSLDLSNLDLDGSIPNTLGNLTNLSVLDLRDNNLTGLIPTQLADLTGLIFLALERNRLSGPVPAELGKLENLRYLDLGHNFLSGAIPAQIGNLTELNTLDLTLNRLTGSIPSQIANLTNLIALHLGANDLTGSIPRKIGNLANLEELSLGENRLAGSVPHQLGDLVNLKRLGLAENALTGPIPPALGNLAKLESLVLSVNSLSGSMPKELGKLTQLFSLGVSHNRLTGCLPSNLASADPAFFVTNPQQDGVTLAVCDGITLSDARVQVPEGSEATYTVRLATAPTAAVTLTLTTSGDDSMTVSSSNPGGTADTLVFTAADWDTSRTVTLSSAQDEDRVNNVTSVTHTTSSADAAYNNLTSIVTAVQADDEPSLSTKWVSHNRAALVLSNYSTGWWLRRSSPTNSLCKSKIAFAEEDLRNLIGATRYTYKAYSDSECMTEIAAVTFTTAPTPLPVPEPGDHFIDDNDTGLEGPINKVATAGITVGCDETGVRFCPNKPVSRAQMAVFLQRALKLPVPADASGFHDSQGFAKNAIAAIAEAGITLGCDATGTRFCPRQPVTRAQMAAFLARALKLPTPDVPPAFEDTTDSGFNNAIAAILKDNITLGCDATGTRFCPRQPVTRAQMAAFLARALKL